MFVTVWLGILDIRTGKLRCANAGHEYPVLRSTIFVYTDGITEATNAQYELCGTDGMLQALNENKQLCGKELQIPLEWFLNRL